MLALTLKPLDVRLGSLLEDLLPKGVSPDHLDWSEEETKKGKRIKVKGFLKDYKVKLFRVAFNFGISFTCSTSSSRGLYFSSSRGPVRVPRTRDYSKHYLRSL